MSEISDALARLDQYKKCIVDVYLFNAAATITLAADATLGDQVIELETGHGVTAGDIIWLEESYRHYQGEAVSVSGDEITLDMPLNYAFTTAATGQRGDQNMAVDGSSTAKTFSVGPPAGVTWNITRILFHITDDAAMDTSTFGGISALTNGIVVRVKCGSTYLNLFAAKENGDFSERSYDTEYDDKAPSGFYGFRCRRTFGGPSKNDLILRLRGDDSDEFQVIVQDDLSGLATLHAVIQGRVA